MPTGCGFQATLPDGSAAGWVGAEEASGLCQHDGQRHGRRQRAHRPPGAPVTAARGAAWGAALNGAVPEALRRVN